MTNFAVFTQYETDEIVQDIVAYCKNNPQKLNFGDKLDLTYNKLEFGFACVMVMVDYNDYATLKEFALVAKLIREARNG